MKVTVELYGLSRNKVGAREMNVDLPLRASLRQLAAELARLHPRLVDEVVRGDGSSLVEPYSFYIEGLGFVTDLKTELKDGVRVALMFASAGG